MAKLSKGNLAAKKDVQVSKVDNWNPPLVPSSTAAQMLPPKSRPLPRVPSTPSGNSQSKSANSELQDSSSKKRRRRRGGKKNGDSNSEVTTTISEDTSAQAATSPTHNGPEVLVPASQSSLSLIPPNASAEEIRVFENEPEMYGLYTLSDGEDQEDDEKRPITVPQRQTRIQAYSPSVATGFAESSPVRDLRAESARPRIGSDVAPSSMIQVPNPKQLSNGKFGCPLKAEYGCTKTFARADGAKRHADAHINTDRFKCEKCDKGFSRQDLYVRHVKTHGKQNGIVKQAETARTKRMHGAHSNGVVDTKRVKNGKMAANVSNSNLNNGPDERDDEEIVQTGDENSMEDGSATGDSDSVQSETDEGEQFNTSRNGHNHNSQKSDRERNGTGGESSVGQYNAATIPTSPNATERTLFSSPGKALSPVEKKQSPVVNGRMKRKRLSPRASPEFDILPSQKRVRRDQDVHSPASYQQIDVIEKTNAVPSRVKDSRVAKISGSQDVDIEMNTQDDQNRERQSNREEIMESDHDPTSSTDVEMGDAGQVQDSDNESASSSDDKAARSPTPVPEQVKTGKIESAAATRTDDSSSGPTSEEEEDDDDDDDDDEVQEQEEAGNNSEVDADPEIPQGRTKTSDEPPLMVHRQSSMDSFVQRSKSATTSARASASGSRVSVDIPVRPRTQTKRTQSRLLLQGRDGGHRSAQSPGISPANDSEGEESSQDIESNANVEEKSRLLSKGKGKARAKDANSRNAANETEEKTSSDDRPRATTVARRTSSLGSKSRPQLKNRTVSKKRTKPASDSDESEQMERPKSKPKRSSKKQTKLVSGEKSEENCKAKHREPASTAKSTWAEASKSGLTGKFAEEEIETLNAWRDSFCRENNLTAYEFNEMMMNSASVSKTDWRYGWITKADFMQQYYDQLPDRNRRSMIRFRERHFHNADTTPWTEAHDTELRQLVAERGTKWVEIAQIMGRTQDAVNQRWRHKLNYGEKPMLTGDWTTEEVKKLEEEVMAFARMKHTTPDDEDLQIPWLAISKKMGNGRTAQQCSNRWRINTSRRVNGKFVKVPHNDRLPGTTVKKPRTPSKMEKRLSGQATPKSEKVYKSAERVEDSEGEEEEEDRDADDESNDAQGTEEPETDDGQEDPDNDEERPEAASDGDEQEHNSQRSEESSTSSSEEADMVSESEQGPSSSKDVVQRPATATAQLLDTSTAATKFTPINGPKLSQNGSSSQPIPKSSQNISHPESPSTQLQPLPSPQSPTFKTPAVSKNPLKRASRNRSSPGQDLSLTQLHAGTQANSSAKRTTGRTNRTRIPDSAITEDRPSPELSLRRRPARSSSPLMSPLLDASRGTTAGDEDEQDENSSDDSGSGNMETDFKSPTSFVSARDIVGASDEDEDEDEQSSTDDDSGSDSSSDSSSDSDSNQPSTFWQSVNQNFLKFTGLSQDGSGSGQNQSKDRKAGLSLADVLRRGAVDESGSDDDD